MAWLTGWIRRKQLYINGSSNSQSGYQLKMTVNYGSGTDGAGNIYCNNNTKTDFSDIRFTDSSGSTLLNYWIDDYSIVSGTKCTVWIQISSIPTGSNSTYIYIYYNNPSATTASNGVNTFPTLFDNFSGTFSKWTHEAGCTYGGGTAGITTSPPASTSNPSMYLTRTDASCGSGATTPLNTLYGGWHAMLYKSSGTQTGSGIVIDIDYARNYTLYYLSEGTVNFYGAGVLIGSATSITVGVWHYFDITRDLSGNWTIYIDGVSKITGNNNTYTTNTKLGIRTTAWPSGSTDYADNIFYRSFVSPEPTWSSISTEQTLINLTINSTPSNARIWLAHPTGASYVDQGANTNNTISNLEPGTYDIKLVLSGYIDWILINQNYTTNQTINATFAGSAYITSSPTGASAYLDGSPTSSGTTPITITNLTSTTSGATAIHTYRLTSAGCPDTTGNFTATAGSTINVPVTFAGYVYISSNPTGARIWLAHPSGTSYIDQGINTNNTLTKDVGTYDVKLVLSGYQDWIGINKTVNSCVTTNIPATLTILCGPPSCNLVVMSILSNQLSKPPGYLNLEIISICIENLIGRYN